MPLLHTAISCECQSLSRLLQYSGRCLVDWARKCPSTTSLQQNPSSALKGGVSSHELASCCADAVRDVLKQITEMHETLQPGQVHDLYHEAYMALLTFQIEDLTEKIGAITTAGGALMPSPDARTPLLTSHTCSAHESIAGGMLAVMWASIELLRLLY